MFYYVTRRTHLISYLLQTGLVWVLPCAPCHLVRYDRELWGDIFDLISILQNMVLYCGLWLCAYVSRRFSKKGIFPNIHFVHVVWKSINTPSSTSPYHTKHHKTKCKLRQWHIWASPHNRHEQKSPFGNAAMQSQNTVSIYLQRKQILPFGFASQNIAHMILNRQSQYTCLKFGDPTPSLVQCLVSARRL